MKILVTGSNGLLGQAIVKRLEARKDISLVAASLHESRLPARGFSFERIDICDSLSVQKVFKKYRPEAVIHTAALTQVDDCERNQAECLRVNVEGTENLLRECEKIKTHFIHLSTDFIFSGEDGPYKEEDKPNPVNFYGRSKLLSEEKVQASSVPGTILRTILVYGAARPNFVHWVVQSLQKNETIRVVSDQVRMPTWNQDLADACIRAAMDHKTGIYHVSGGDPVSIFEFAKIISDTCGLDGSRILPVTSREFKQPARRPLKTGFILEKARQELGYQPHPLREAIEAVRKDTNFS